MNFAQELSDERSQDRHEQMHCLEDAIQAEKIQSVTETKH